MSAPREGMKLAKAGQRMTERMADGVYTAAPNDDPSQGGAQAVAFRRKFDVRDSYDDEMNTKMQLMDKDGMTPFGQVFYDDKVGRWLERKAAVAETANFDAYFGKEFNKNDLASRQFAQKINPEYYAQREAEMNDRANMVVKLKGIQLRGPQSKEDLYTLYLLESGRVKLPADWDRIGAGVADPAYNPVNKQNQDNLAFGMIRMPLFLSQVQRARAADGNLTRGYYGSQEMATDVFGPRGNPTARNIPLTGPSGGTTQTDLFLSSLRGGFQ